MLYKVLTAFEEAGRCQRGYFVESLGGAQFAVASTVDRLRGYADPLDTAPDLPTTPSCWPRPTRPTRTAPRCPGRPASPGTVPAARPVRWW